MHELFSMKRYVLILQLVFWATTTLKAQYPFGSSQKKEFSLYVGAVKGFSAIEYNTSRLKDKNDSLLQIPPLSKSNYPIEIRLYETTDSWVNLYSVYCTILYYDTAWHIIRKRYRYTEPRYADKFDIVEKQPIENINPDTAFKKLIENGIFSLVTDRQSENIPKVLTNNGLIDFEPLCACPHCRSYEITTKVDTVFNIVYVNSNNTALLKCFPDNDLEKRKKNIVDQLKVWSAIVPKTIIDFLRLLLITDQR